MRKILIVIDMQKDFVDGALGTKEAVAIVPNVVEKIKRYDIKDVFATRDTHQPNYMETQEGKNLPVVHCVEGTEGWEINKAVAAVLDGATIFDKPTFGSTALCDAILKLSKEEELEIEMVGLCTDICVVSNALLIKATFPEAPIAVDAGCCAGVTPQAHEAALATMASCQITIE